MRKIYSFFIICSLLFAMAPALSKQLKFDPNLMSANGISDIQLDNALNQHVLPQGDTQAEIYINDHFISSDKISSVNGKVVYSDLFKSKSGIKKSQWRRYKKTANGKYYVLNPEVKEDFDRSDNSLRIQIPVTYLINPDGKMRTSGGTGAFINYNTYAYRFSGSSDALESTNTEYEAGLNMNNTILRSHGSYSSFRSRGINTSVNRVRDGYIERNVASVKIRAGRTMVSDGGFGTGYIDGAVISSAEGNATAFVNFTYDTAEVLLVEFWQNNLLLYKQMIQKGHAELRNIPVSGFTGDVMVLIKRNGQIVDSRVISRGQITTVREGVTGYYAFAGRTATARRSLVSGAGFSKYFSKNISPSVALVSASKYRGITVNNTTLNGNFRSASWLSAVQNEKNQKGLSLNVTASYKNTSLTYTRNSRHFSYIDQALMGSYSAQQSSIGLSQTLQLPKGITGSLSLTHYRFYDAPSQDSLSASMSIPVAKASLGMGVAWMSLAPGHARTDKLSVNLTLSVPLRLRNRSVNWRSQYYRYGERARLSNSVSASVTDNYRLTASQMRTSGSGRSETYTLDNAVTTPYTTADISLSQGNEAGESSRTTAAYLSGAVAISKEGVVFSPGRIGDTWAVVNTGVHHFLNVTSLQSSSVTNHDGKAIISPVAEQRGDFIRVNPEGLPSGVIIKNNVREFSAAHGSVSYFNFDASKNSSLLMKWNQMPGWVNQSDLFYNKEGKLIARFIDKQILLINEEDIKFLQGEGMSSPGRTDTTCKISTKNIHKKEDIINVNFICSHA
ncbi:fimbria/pilus outer membrane usher protein [Erwinia papayae]|uniref:Fimbria/pilus outer membrane usher protein n=1 Tax=Erwinia papayae TaxID=206499 RepID=A0ABV3N212_9GAMM